MHTLKKEQLHTYLFTDYKIIPHLIVNQLFLKVLSYKGILQFLIRCMIASGRDLTTHDLFDAPFMLEMTLFS